MKIYKVWREDWDWDEYDAFVVRAKSKKRAIEMSGFGGKDVIHCKPVPKQGKEEEILSSFKAG